MLYKGSPNQTVPAGNPIPIPQGVPTKFSLLLATWYSGSVTLTIDHPADMQVTINIPNPIQLTGSAPASGWLFPDAITMLVTAPVGTYETINVSTYTAYGSGDSGSSQVLITTPPTPIWLRGDLNHNGIPADAGDLVLMKQAAIGDWSHLPAGTSQSEYDLNFNGMPADAGDLVLMKRAAIGEIDLNAPPYNDPCYFNPTNQTCSPSTIYFLSGDNYISFSKLRTDLTIGQILVGVPGYTQIFRWDAVTGVWISCSAENIKPDTGYHITISAAFALALTGTDIPSSLSDIVNSLKNGYNLVSCGITPLDVSTSPIIFTDPITGLRATTLLPTKSYWAVYPPGCSGTIAVV